MLTLRQLNLQPIPIRAAWGHRKGSLGLAPGMLSLAPAPLPALSAAEAAEKTQQAGAGAAERNASPLLAHSAAPQRRKKGPTGWHRGC